MRLCNQELSTFDASIFRNWAVHCCVAVGGAGRGLWPRLAKTAPRHAKVGVTLAISCLWGGTHCACVGAGVALARMEQLLAGDAFAAKGANLHGCGTTFVVGLPCPSLSLGNTGLDTKRIGAHRGCGQGKATRPAHDTADGDLVLLCDRLLILA